MIYYPSDPEQKMSDKQKRQHSVKATYTTSLSLCAHHIGTRLQCRVFECRRLTTICRLAGSKLSSDNATEVQSSKAAGVAPHYWIPKRQTRCSGIDAIVVMEGNNAHTVPLQPGVSENTQIHGKLRPVSLNGFRSGTLGKLWVDDRG